MEDTMNEARDLEVNKEVTVPKEMVVAMSLSLYQYRVNHWERELSKAMVKDDSKRGAL